MRRVFITEYVGLGTRLESLAVAFMISDYFGHEVCIDWNEFDAFNVVGARVRGRGLLGRLGSLKPLDDAGGELHRIAAHRNVNLRTHHGPRHLLEKYYLPTARRVKLRPDLIDVAFFVSCSGSLDAFPNLQKNFDIFDMPAASPYEYKQDGSGHQSRRHPATDLFALGCCSTLIGSPCSTFTHYAANMLGQHTTVLVPPAHKTFPSRPELCRTDLYGRGAFGWYAACRTGQGPEAVTNAARLPITRGASVDWM